MRQLIKNGYVVTVNERREIFAPGYVAVENEKIQAVGPTGSEPAGDYQKVFDAKGMVVTPGLINMHQHPWMNLLKGLADGLLLEPWVFSFVQPFLDQLTLEDLRISAYLSALEMLRTGTTCALDHTTRLPDGYEEALIQPMAEVGIRHVLAKLFQCRTPKLPSFPLSAKEAQAAGAELVLQHHNSNGGLTRIALAIECNAHHTELGKSSDELVRAGYELACAKDLRIPVHMSAGTLSMSMGFLKYLRLTGRRDVAYLDQLGVLDHRWLLKHGIHFSDVDNETIRARGAAVVYTPTSEAVRGGGLGPIAKLHRMGINCCLGSDGPMVDYSVDMVEQMKATIFLQNLKHRGVGAVSVRAALEMATLNAARALGLESELGSLEPGKKADIAVFDVSRLPFDVTDPLVALVCGGRGADAHSVFVNGRNLIHEGRFTEFDQVADVVREANVRGRRIAHAAKLDQRAKLGWPTLQKVAAE